MPMNDTAHNVDEYYVGKGIVTMQPLGDAAWFDLGNVPEFEFTPNMEQLEHLSSRAGVRVRDRTVVIEKGGELRIVLEEWTTQNLAIILMGDVTDDVGPPTGSTIDILSKSEFSASIRFQGMNDIGPRWNFEFLRVDFVPSGSINPISEEWGSFEITGQLAAVDVGAGVMSFGTAKRLDSGASPAWPAGALAAAAEQPAEQVE